MKRTDSKGRTLQNGERQKADGRYEFRYSDSQGIRHSVYSWRLISSDKAPPGKKRGLALRELEREIQKDLLNGLSSEHITLDNLFERFYNSKSFVKPSTLYNYKFCYKTYISSVLGAQKITRIRYSDIREIYLKLLTKDKLKLASVSAVNSVLVQLLNIAVKDNIIAKNPAAGVLNEIRREAGLTRGKRHALTPEEQDYFMKYVIEHDRYRRWIPLFVFLLGTGCRIGEAASLTWDDVDFENNVISITKNMLYLKNDGGNGLTFHISTPKSSAGIRKIPMLAEVRETLLEERQRQQEYGECPAIIDGVSGFVFMNSRGGIEIPSSVSRAIERIRVKVNEEYGCNIRHFSAHNFRHTFCTRLCENETNLKLIQEIMGHSSIQITMDVYNETTDSLKQKNFEGLNGKIKIYP